MNEPLMDPMVPLLYQVEHLTKETHDTFTMGLQPANSRKLTLFQAGQFNMLYVFGVGEIPISISSSPLEQTRLRHTTPVVGHVSRALGWLKPGAAVGVRGPFGSHWPIENAQGKDVVMIAGGMGLAPLRPVVYELLAQREQYQRIILLYGARTPEDILYKKELEQWRAKFDLEVHITVDRAGGSWRGNVDVVTALIPRAPFHPPNTTAFVCGPEVMMGFTVRVLKQRGLKNEDIFISMERNMKCAVGFCGHCQYGPYFICKDGPVFRYDRVERIFRIAEI